LYKTECTPEQAAQDLAIAIQNNQIVADFDQFYLGASSSAYQIEGGLDDSSAAARFYRDKVQLPTADVAIDFYHRYPEIINKWQKNLILTHIVYHLHGIELSHNKMCLMQKLSHFIRCYSYTPCTWH